MKRRHDPADDGGGDGNVEDSDVYLDSVYRQAAKRQQVEATIRDLECKMGNCTEQVDERKDQIENLEGQIESLETQIEGYQELLDEEYVALAEEMLMDAIVPYSKREMLTLTTLMQDRLPRELRDTIWEIYWNTIRWQKANDDGMPKFDHKLNRTLFTKSCAPAHKRCQCFDWKRLPTGMLPAFVGLQTAQEACSELLRHVSITPYMKKSKMEPRISVESLSEFLSRDFLHVGIPLVYASLDNFCVAVRSAALRKGRGSSNLSRMKMSHVKQQLQHLLDVRGKDSLSITFEFGWRSVSTIDFERFLELFRDVYSSLTKDRPICIKSHTCFAVAGEKSTMNFKLEDFTINGINDYYRMPLRDWRLKYGIDKLIEYEKRKHLGKSFDESAMVD